MESDENLPPVSPTAKDSSNPLGHSARASVDSTLNSEDEAQLWKDIGKEEGKGDSDESVNNDGVFNGRGLPNESLDEDAQLKPLNISGLSDVKEDEESEGAGHDDKAINHFTQKALQGGSQGASKPPVSKNIPRPRMNGNPSNGLLKRNPPPFERRESTLEGIVHNLGGDLKLSNSTTNFKRGSVSSNYTLDRADSSMELLAVDREDSKNEGGSANSFELPTPVFTATSSKDTPVPLMHKCTEQGYWRYSRNPDTEFKKPLYLRKEPTTNDDDSAYVTDSNGKPFEVNDSEIHIDRRIRDLGGKQVFLHIESDGKNGRDGWVFEANPGNLKDKIFVNLTQSGADPDIGGEEDSDDDEEEEADIDDLNIAETAPDDSSTSQLVQHHNNETRRISVTPSSLTKSVGGFGIPPPHPNSSSSVSQHVTPSKTQSGTPINTPPVRKGGAAQEPSPIRTPSDPMPTPSPNKLEKTTTSTTSSKMSINIIPNTPRTPAATADTKNQLKTASAVAKETPARPPRSGIPASPGVGKAQPPPGTRGGGIPPPPGMGGIPPPPGMGGIPPPPGMGGIPPPPGMGGIPPPPGMALPAFGALPAKPQLEPREELPKPSKPLKKLHWEPVELDELKDTLWETTLKNLEFDMVDFDKLFQKAVRKKKKKKTPGSAKKSVPKSVSLLESKREVNISIALNAFKMTVERLCDSITHIELHVLNPERLISLIKILPNEEEEKAVGKFKGDPSQLTKPSLFQYEMCKIPHIRKRLEQVLFMSTLDSRTTVMRVNIKLVWHALRAILKNPNIHKIMHLVLTIGNYMNHGNRKGNAHGFHISLLQKLNVTKSTTGLSLMDWLVNHLARKDAKILKFTSDFRKLYKPTEKKTKEKDVGINEEPALSLDDAARVETDVILQGLSALRGKLKELGKDLKNMAKEEEKAKAEVMRRKSSLKRGQQNATLSSPNSPTSARTSATSTREPSPVPTNHFYKAMVSQFIGAAKKSKKLDQMYNDMIKTFNRLKRFLGVKDIEKPEDLLEIFSEFLAAFDQAVYDLKAREKKRQRDKRRAETANERRARKLEKTNANRSSSRGRRQGSSLEKSMSSPNVHDLSQ